MSTVEYCIYECTSPACGLRFPARVGALRSERCPRCKALIRRVVNLSLEREAEQRKRLGVPGLPLETLLDNVRSGWNVGAMFRTADGLGGGRMHLCGITPMPDHPQVVKTALGAEKELPWVYASNAVQHCQELRSRGYSIWALEDTPQAEVIFDLRREDIKDILPVLVVGNEVSGVDPEILALCQRVLAIPMHGAKRSLNVAVAYGIALGALQHLP